MRIAPQQKQVGAIAVSSVCDEYVLFLFAEWLGIHLTRGPGPSSDQSALYWEHDRDDRV